MLLLPQNYIDTLHQIEQCQHTLQSPNTSNELRLELEAKLADFKCSRGSHVISCAILHAFLLQSRRSGDAISIILPHTVHFLGSVIEYWGGDLARLQSLCLYDNKIGNNISSNSKDGSSSSSNTRNARNNSSHNEELVIKEFVQMVRQIVLEAYQIRRTLDINANENKEMIVHVPDFQIGLNLIQQQVKVAYCRMGRCIWRSSNDDSSHEFDFVRDCCVLASSSTQDSNDSNSVGLQECGCAILATFCEELSRDDLVLSSPIPAARSVQLRLALNKYLPDIVSCVANVISQSLQSSSLSLQSHQLQSNASVVKDCLKCTTSILGFGRCLQLKSVDTSKAISINLIRSLFAVIDLAAQADGHTDLGSEQIETGAYAFDCLSEVINRACWPKGEAENFVIELSSHALKSLAIECTAIEVGRKGEDEPICVEQFRSQASHFLETFCMNQLSRASRLPSATFDVSAFLQLMARYTFALPSALEQTDCLVSWIRVAEFFETSSVSALPSANYISSHGNGLAEVLVAVIRLNLFLTNNDKLAELDGENLDFPDESIEVNQNDVEIHFEETSHSWQKGQSSMSGETTHNHLPSHIDAALRSSERGSLLAESCTLSSILCTISAQCAISAYEKVTLQLKYQLTQLNSVISNNDSNMDENATAVVDKISWDVCACYRFLDSGNVALTAVSHRRNLSNGESALNELWELCNILISTSESLLSSRAWSKYSNLAYILSTSCTCLATFHRGLCALANHDDIFRSPAEKFATNLLDLCLFALNSFTTLPAPSFVVSATCSLLKNCADSLSLSLLSPKYLQMGDNSFSLKCREAALSSLERQSSLSRRQLRSVYQSSIKLIFPLGCIENSSSLSPILKGLFDEQSSIWVTMVVNGLCQELTLKSQELKEVSNESSPMRIIQKCGISIQRACQALTSLLIELSTMGDGSRQIMANAIGNSMQHVGFLTGVYNTYSMSGGTHVASATESLLSLQVKLIQVLNKYVGVQYQIEVLKTVISTINASDNTATALPHGKLLCQKALIELLITIFNTRDRRLFELLHETCNILKVTLIPLCMNPPNAPELLPHLIRLIHVILSMQWRNFSAASSDDRDLKSSILAPRVTRINDAFKAEFDLFIEIILNCIKTSDLPPSIVHDAICITIDLGQIIKLFKVKDFEERFRNIFLSTIMEVLLQQSQPMHVENLTNLLQDIVNSDMEMFFSDFLPSLVSGMSLPEEGKGTVINSWPHDVLSFTSGCHDFLSECRYAMNKQRHHCNNILFLEVH